MNSFTPLGHVSPLPHLLQALRALLPPACVVHVGAGHGTGDLALWRQWPELPAAVVIDADDTRLSWATAHPQARVVHATVAASEGPHPYHRASNPQEDGLLPPAQLQAWWPQLQTLATDTRHARTLDQLLPTDGTHTPAHWLLIDCLPAATLLQGASQLLAHTRVVCARTSHTPPDANAAQPAGADQPALLDCLAPLGFVPLAQTETHHPALGYTIMARPPSALLAEPETRATEQTPADWSAKLPTEAAAPVAPPIELQAENEALRHRLSLLQEELLRAEGQINLIKDLMLRDQEL